jgi:hypothetical protein
VIIPQSKKSLNKNSRIRRRSARSKQSPLRECADCSYATYPGTGRCTNVECPKHRRERGAMTGEQLLREYAPPALYHGRRWGTWMLDVERLCLVHQGHPVDRGDGSGITKGVPRYVAFIGSYEIDLERIADSASALDWIFQVAGKTWANARVTKDLLNALDDVIHPQANLCSGACGSGHGDRVIKDPGAFLRNRIATAGVKDAA